MIISIIVPSQPTTSAQEGQKGDSMQPQKNKIIDLRRLPPPAMLQKPQTLEALYAREWITRELFPFRSFVSLSLEEMVFCEANILAFEENQKIGSEYAGRIFHIPVTEARQHLIRHSQSIGELGLKKFFCLHEGPMVKRRFPDIDVELVVKGANASDARRYIELSNQFNDLVASMSHPAQVALLYEAFLLNGKSWH